MNGLNVLDTALFLQACEVTYLDGDEALRAFFTALRLQQLNEEAACA